MKRVLISIVITLAVAASFGFILKQNETPRRDVETAVTPVVQSEISTISDSNDDQW